MSDGRLLHRQSFIQFTPSVTTVSHCSSAQAAAGVIDLLKGVISHQY